MHRGGGTLFICWRRTCDGSNRLVPDPKQEGPNPGIPWILLGPTCSIDSTKKPPSLGALPDVELGRLVCPLNC